MKTSRRRFLELAALGSTAALLDPLAGARAAAAPSRRRRKPATAPDAGAAHAREVAKLKGYVADTLKAIREHHLATGAEQAFVFRPMKAGPRRRSR